MQGKESAARIPIKPLKKLSFPLPNSPGAPQKNSGRGSGKAGIAWSQSCSSQHPVEPSAGSSGSRWILGSANRRRERGGSRGAPEGGKGAGPKQGWVFHVGAPGCGKSTLTGRTWGFWGGGGFFFHGFWHIFEGFGKGTALISVLQILGNGGNFQQRDDLKSPSVG